MIKTSRKIISLIILLLLLIASLATIVTHIDQFSTVDIGEESPRGGWSSSPSKLGGINPEGGGGSCKPLFYISNNDNTTYIKSVVGVKYDGKKFRLRDEEKRPYQGEKVEAGVKAYKSEVTDEIKIEPIMKFDPGFIPISLHTTEVDLSSEDMTNLTYYPEHNIFNSNSTFSDEYDFTTTHYKYSESVLESSGSVGDDRYLQIPDVITNRTKDLSEQITKGLESPYRKAVEIREYLMSHYTYDKFYTRAPEDHEPIDWFLFEEKKGVCANFNCAFAILCRISDVPTRVVSGFRVESTLEKKPVLGCDAHCWMELGLDVGWLTTDATPGFSQGINEKDETEKIGTNTEITNVSRKNLMKKGKFTVEGRVWNKSGIDVDGMHVQVHLTKSKSSSLGGIICGKGFVKDSRFEINCSIPVDVRVGDYHLIAHAVKNNIYKGSESDPKIKVLSETSISLKYPIKSYRNNTVEIRGKLTEMGDFNISNRQLILSMNGEKKGNITTDRHGNFSFNRSFKKIGNYSFTFKFKGGEYYLPSSSYCVIEIKKINLYFFDDLVINDGNTRLKGRLMVDSIPVSEEYIRLRLDDENFIKNRTVSDGGFSYKLDEDIENGIHEFDIYVPKTGRSIEREVKIKTKTILNMSITEKTKEKIDLKLHLEDFKSEELSDQKLFLNNSFLDESEIRKTNEEGFSTFTIEIPEKLENNKLTLTGIYDGDENYSSSEVHREIDLDYIKPPEKNKTTAQDRFELDQTLIVLLAVIAVGLVSTGYAWKKGYISILISKFSRGKEILEDKRSKHDVDDIKKNYIIDFPAILDELPLVWGVGDQIRIDINSDSDNVRLLIDGDKKDIERQEDHHTYTTKFDEKGEHKIEGILDDYTETLTLRIVEYQEEIQREYTEFLDLLKKNNIDVGNRTTPLEVEFNLRERLGEHEGVFVIRKFFEKSKYSYYDVDRQDYVQFMKAKIKVVKEIEKDDQEVN